MTSLWRIASLLVLLAIGVESRRHYSEEEDESPAETKSPLLMPSKRAIEMVGVKFIDALIKRGQMEMAKGAFKTQLEVLEKVHPDQYKKYKKLSVDELAADAVLQQSEMAKLQPKTGNPFVDMLNENGIPIASSIKGLEQAIKTQREMETQDPSEQIAKAVLEKFQQQILPGLVANMIAGRNPFKLPQQMRQAQAPPEEVRRQAMAAQQQISMGADPFFGNQVATGGENTVRRMPERRRNMEIEEEDEREDGSNGESNVRSLASRLRQSPSLRALLQNPEVAAALSPRMHDYPMRRPLADKEVDEDTEQMLKTKTQIDGKAAIVMGLHDLFGEGDENDESEEEKTNYQETNSIRRSPLSLPSSFLDNLEQNDEIKEALGALTYRVNDVEKYLEPKKLIINPKPQPGYFVPRKLPTRARKMLPLLIGLDPNEDKAEIRRKETKEQKQRKSRVIANLQNNPNIAPLFMDGKLEERLTGRQFMTNDQKGRTYSKVIKAYPRLFAAKTHHPLDSKVSQVIEERPVPLLNWTPKGKHTRLRWTGATEKEIPGLGGRFIVPSLDPTTPALNTAYSTQGRAREEWDTMFKIPNSWSAGDELGFSMNSKSKRFIGGNAALDMPAAEFG